MKTILNKYQVNGPILLSNSIWLLLHTQRQIMKMMFIWRWANTTEQLDLKMRNDDVLKIKKFNNKRSKQNDPQR